MQIAKWEWKKLIHDWKTRILLFAFFIFYGTFSLLYQQQTVNFPEEQMEKQYNDIRQLFNTIPTSDFQGDVGEEVYDHLANLQMLYGLQLYILSQQEGNTITGFEGIFSDYLDYGTQIANSQARLLELDEFAYYDYMVSFLPEKESIQKDVAFYDYMEKHDLDIEWNSFSASNILFQEIHFMLGFSLFLFIALLASDRFTKDQVKNWSITQGIPVPWKKQWHIKTVQLWGVLWVVSLAGLLMSYLISLLIETPGSLWYPVMILLPNGYVSVAIWIYAILAIILGMLLSYFLLLLTVGLSWIFRTIYFTILVTLGIYFIPFIWQSLQPLSSLQPSLYLHIEPVLSGALFEETGLRIHFLKAIPLLLILILAVEGAFTLVFDRIQTQTLGLRRRTNP